MKIGKLFSVLLLILFFVVAFWISNDRTQKIRKNKSVTSGFIYETSSAYKGGINISYSLYVDNDRLDGSSFLGVSSSYRNIFLNKWFPVVYDAKDPKENHILIMPDDFKKYGIDFPDSLDWVTDYNR